MVLSLSTPISILLFVLPFIIHSTHARSTSLWPGWDQISTIFAFGDSYTATGFQVNGTQPKSSNAFGNPDFPGLTFSNGRNWIDFLTYTYNESFISTYNFAKSGAIVDSFGFQNPFRPMTEQVNQFFLPNYSLNNTSNAQWSSNSTLFASFFGLNDILFGNGSTNAAGITTYVRLVEQLYQAGARNFLFLNVPPVHRAPFMDNQGNLSAQFIEQNRTLIVDYNTRIANMVQDLVATHSDATAFLIDTFSLYNDVLDDPGSREETTVYTNTTGFCFSYSRRTYNEDEFNSRCEIPQREFFWLDPLHPTPPVHDAMAAEIATQFRNEEFVGRHSSRPDVFTGRSSRLAVASLQSWLPWIAICIIISSAFSPW